MKYMILLIFIMIVSSIQAADQPEFTNLKSVRSENVKISDTFWRGRQKAVITKGILHCQDQCENNRTYIKHIKDAGDKLHGKPHGEHKGFYWDDYFPHRVVENIGYALAIDPQGDDGIKTAQEQLSQILERWIPLYQRAQEPDGYFDSYYTLTGQKKMWEFAVKHELFLMGTLIEAGMIHYRATKGKDTRVFDIALKCADYLCEKINPQGWKIVPGHPGIEFAMFELGELIDERDGKGAGDKYKLFAKFLIDNLGGRDLYGKCHSGTPFIAQQHATGHAVRANYLYMAAADVARWTGSKDYVAALDKIWESAVERRMYITGGVGLKSGEAYGNDYELPSGGNLVYQESCASCAMVMLQYRMFLLHQDAKYIDVMERGLFNAMLAGIGHEGDSFFYENPLERPDGKHKRWAWHNCSCCPGNLIRMILRVGDYFYAHTDDSIFVNLYGSNDTTVDLKDGSVALSQRSNYPWDGEVSLTVTPSKQMSFTLRLRIPKWADKHDLKVNGKSIAAVGVKGYAFISREWEKGDTVELSLPMEAKRLYAHPQVDSVVGKVALQRGPFIYCLEAVDNGGKVLDIELSKDVVVKSEHRKDLLGGVMVLTGTARLEGKPKTIMAIPYFSWANRTPAGPMTVWIKESE